MLKIKWKVVFRIIQLLLVIPESGLWLLTVFPVQRSAIWWQSYYSSILSTDQYNINHRYSVTYMCMIVIGHLSTWLFWAQAITLWSCMDQSWDPREIWEDYIIFSCHQYYHLQDQRIITTIIIIITRPKPAYGRQGLAGGSLRTSGAQLWRGKWSFFVTNRQRNTSS